ncbi:hypothetical protein M885DRAFT_506950 [Pelagophyceae sp. CCMP2097]|nr:hypothetical protein M885DRAFT_506950 [Pelagophyceae sp. CCMP2097]
MVAFSHMLPLKCAAGPFIVGAVVAIALAHVLPCVWCTAPLKGKKLEVVYFDLPGPGEPLRLLLALGGFDFTDTRVPFSEWPALKPTTKWGQLPALNVDGEQLTQHSAISHFLAKQIRIDGKLLYPKDALKALHIDEIIDAFEDVRKLLVPTFKIADQKEKEAARAQLFSAGGACTALLVKINQFAACNAGPWIVGGSCTLADVWCFYACNFLRSTFWDGLPTNFLDQHTKLSKVCNAVASIPAVAAFYAPLADHKFYKAHQVRQ